MRKRVREKRNALSKNKYIKYFPIFIIPIVVCLVYIFNYLFNTYTPYIVVENEGYMVGNNEILNVLNKEDISSFDNSLKVVHMHEDEYIYKMALDRYSNEEKEIVDLNYPMYINDGLSIVNYNDNTNLIDNDLHRIMGSSNQVYAYGKAYELNNYEPIDKTNYILLAYPNGVYINLYDLKISTNANEYEIPVNSLVYFMNDRINCFVRNGDTFVKTQIIDIDYDNIFTFYYESADQEYKYKYENLLAGLGKIYLDEMDVPPKEIIDEKDQIEVIDENSYAEEPINKPIDENTEWVKPVVTATHLIPGVYSATGNISIEDPASVIVKEPSLSFVYNGKTYSRRSFHTSGEFVISGLMPNSEFEVVGQYTYLDQDMRTKKIVTFFHETINTRSMDMLDPIDLDFSLGSIYPRKIELKDLKITSNLTSETLRGVRSIAFRIDGERYYFSNQNVTNLINGKTIDTVSTSESLASNTEYNFEIVIYDTMGNELNVHNNKGKTRTSKKYPSVMLKVTENDTDHVTLKVDLKNEDDIDVSNYRYVITNSSGKVIQQNLIDSNKIVIENLDPNQMFTIKIYADFDLDDGVGLRKDYELTSVDFTSLPITSLGFVNLNFEVDNLTSDDISLKYKINNKKTDAKLIKLIKNIKFEVYDVNGDNTIKSFYLSADNVNSLKALEEVELYINGLDSNTRYNLNITTTVQQGETIYELECLHNLDYFETYKKKPIIDVKSSFVTNDMIDFDVRVIDSDNAILSNRVRVELRDSKAKLVDARLIDIKEEYERITYKHLTSNATYNIVFIADEYNETNNNSTFKSRYELKNMEKFTEDGISGKIELNSAVKVANGENLSNIYSETQWSQSAQYYTMPKTVDDDGVMHIYSRKGASAYTYDLREYEGEYVTVTFKIRAVNKLDERVYFVNYVSGSTSNSYGMYLDDITTDKWTSYTYSFIVGTYKSGNNHIVYTGKYNGRNPCDFAGFYINNGVDEIAEYEVKDFEIHRAKDKVSVDVSETAIEQGLYGSDGKKSSSTATNYRYYARVAEPLVLEGDQVYEILFSDDTNYTAYIYFLDATTNKYVSSYGWFESGRIVYVPNNMKMYLFFRNYSGNMELDPEDIHLRVNKYVSRGNIDYQPFTYDFITKVRVNVKDLHNEIENDTYYIRVSDDNNNEIYVRSYEELENTDTITNVLKKLDLNERKNYRVSLFIKIRDREYELDYFTLSTYQETVGISTLSDWTFIQPYGNYIILNDLVFKDYTSQTLGWGYHYFYGMIDFQGYSADIYSDKSFSRIGRIEKTGVLKNAVINVHLDNQVNNNNMNGFVQVNYGTIENVMVNVYDERNKYFDDTTMAALVGKNETTGVIRNFVLNLKTRVNLYWNSGLLVRENNGLVENGYVYGENAFVTNARSNVSVRQVGLIQKTGNLKSTVQNVYILSSIEFPNNYSYDLTGLLAYETYGKVKNVYTTGSVNNANQAVGPIVGYVRDTGTLDNAYYYNDYIYTTLNQNKISALSLNDSSFQRTVLKDKFNIDEMLELGYYPQVKFTFDKMPNQDFIELPKVEEESSLELLNIEVTSSTYTSAIVNLTIQNDYGDEITKVSISNLDTEIIAQNYDDGKSYVSIKVSNPQVYVSKYEIRGITSISYNNIVTERKYPLGEKYLFIDLYREINNVDDWKSINTYLNQNFAIMEDLDFREEVNYYINNFTGKIDGNNHVLKNIDIINGKSALFNRMDGTLKNIYFENVSKTTGAYYIGIAANTNQYASFENVHVKNMKIEIPADRTSNTIEAGGLTGYSYYSKFTNCSVTNIYIHMPAMINDIQIGGMVGYSNGASFNNVYVQDAEIIVENALGTNGVGGIVGREVASVGNIFNAYTTGEIRTNGRYTGGIAGSSYGYIENSYSMMNIVSDVDAIGGITGRVEKNDYVNNNLFMGNLASKMVNTPIYYILGNKEAKDTNFALTTSLINGFPSTDYNGAKPITISQLMRESNYNNDAGLQLGNAYDYSKVSEGIVPKLYYMDTDELLPNQKDIYFLEDIFETIDIVIDKHVDYSTIVFYLRNNNHFTIDDIEIEDMNVHITQNAYQDGISIVTLEAQPLKYFDSYYVKGIKYHTDDANEQLYSKKSIFLEMPFYKYLRTYEDWQNVSKYDAENYLLMNDIDFTGRDFNRDVLFNRLETISDSEVHTLKGFRVTQTSSKNDLNIIKKVMSSMKNIQFEDIDIEFLQTTNNDYTNLISYAYGEIKNVTFKDIIINAPNKNRVAMIGRGYTQLVDGIKFDHITLSGRNYVGCLYGYYENTEDLLINNIEAVNINVTGNGNYISGIFPSITGTAVENLVNITNVSIKDSSIIGTNSTYVGAVSSYGGASYVVVDNVHVKGKIHVGAAFGATNIHTIYDVTVKNSYVEGSGYYIGGLAGQVRYYLYDSLVENTRVEGTAAETYAVGGVLGIHSYSTTSRVSIKDSTVNNNGNKTGGYAGELANGTFSYISIDNVIVNGIDNVGGVAGVLTSGTINITRVTNSTINAQGSNVGGIVGYFNNSVSSSTFYEGTTRQSMVLATTISGNSIAGGFIGKKNEKLYNPQNDYALYFDSTITTNDNYTAGIAAGDSSNQEFVNLPRIGVYEGSTVNGQPIKNSVSNTIKDTNLITDFIQGFINESGVIETNYNYPNATYTNFIKLEAGKSYVLQGKNRVKSSTDIFRVRYYDINKNYVGNLNDSSSTFNYMGNYYSLGNQSEVYFTPIRDMYVRVVYFYEIEESSFREVESTYANMLESRLLTANQLRSRLLWNRYVSDSHAFYYKSFFNLDAAAWDFSTLNNEATNITVPDRSGNGRDAKASFTTIDDHGIFTGGVRDQVLVNNYTPSSDITINATFTSYNGNSYQYLFSYRDASNNNGVGLYIGGKTICATINGSNYSTSYTVPLYKEVNVTMTYENSKILKVYVDGVLIFTNNNVNRAIKTSANAKTYIANDTRYSDGYKFVGLVKNIDVYSRALPANEIANNYYSATGITNTTNLELSYDFSELNFPSTGYYPLIKNVQKQANVPLPSRVNGSSNLPAGSSRVKAGVSRDKLEGNYHIYPSGIDTINIEFDKLTSDLSFSYQMGEEKLEYTKVEQRVYTLKYDYKSNIEIKIKNAYEEKIENFESKDLAKTISIYDGAYYHIDNNKLYNSHELVRDNALNIYKNLVLLDDGKIYNIATNKVQNTLATTNLIRTTLPLYQATLNGSIVSTYYSFTEVIDADGDVRENDYQLIYKDGYLYMINSNNKNNSNLIVNYYNGNEYQISLGNNKEIYSYKASLELHSSFINTNIKEINADFDSNLPIIMVRYENGEILVLNYYNGDKLFSSGEPQSISLTSYIGLSLRSNDVARSTKSYKDNNTLNDSLNSVSDKDIIKLLEETKANNKKNVVIDDSNDNNEDNKDAIIKNNEINNQYVMTYNEDKEEYELYDIEDVLLGDSPNTVNSKINSNKTLYNYFYNNTKVYDVLKDNRLLIYIAIIILIIVNLVYFVLKSRKKEA